MNAMNLSHAFFFLTIISFVIIYGLRRMSEYYRTKAYNKD